MFSVTFWALSFLILSMIVIFIGICTAEVQDDSITRKILLFVISTIVTLIFFYMLTMGIAFLRAMKDTSIILWLFMASFFNSITYGLVISLFKKGDDGAPVFWSYVCLFFAIALTLGGC